MVALVPIRQVSQEIPADKLTRSQRYWYAQALADAIYRKGWMKLIPRRPNDNVPGIKSIGGCVVPKPRMVEAHVFPVDSSRIPEARIYLGFLEYQVGLNSMTREEWDAWWKWMAPKKDKWGRPVGAPALYRSSGDRVVPNSEHTNRAEQQAALRILQQSRIDVV